MSENSKINYRDLLKKTAVTYEQTVERVKSEQQRPQVDRFRIGEDGDYAVRILPLAPYLTSDGQIDETRPLRESFEYPLKQMFLDIKGEPKKKGGKPSVINIPVICATQDGVGKSVDLIDTYKKLVKEYYPDDKEIIDLVNKGRFEKGLKWSYLRVLYVFDLDSNKRTPLLWQPSFAQYNDFVDRQIKLWDKLKAKNSDAEDPLAGFGVSYALEITRKTENKKTGYSFNIDMTSEDELDDKDMEALFNAPRIPDVIYRYTKYQMEATIEFLKQYDEEHGLDIMQEEAMLNAIDKLKGELDANDQSHFDLATAGDGKGEGGAGKLTLEQLNDRYDALLDAGIADDSDEGIELREDIRAYVEENDLKVTMKHSMSTADILDAVEEAEQNKPATTTKKDEQEPEPEPEQAPARRSRRAAEPEPEPEPKNEPEPEPEPEPEQTGRRRRAARPTREDDNDAAPENKENEAPAEENTGERRRRRRSTAE